MAVVPGLLLADWDEARGPVVVQTLMPDITEPPEVLAAQMYVSAQNVFSNEQFSAISFSLPLLKIKRKVKIFFNYVEDKTVRGGRRPFIFCIFLDLDTRDTTFEVLDEIIDGEIAKYRVGNPLDLNGIQSQIIDRLKTPALPAPEEEAPEEEASQPPSADSRILKVICEKCQKAIRIKIDRDKIPNRDRIPYTYRYPHGDKSPAGRHSIELKLDGNLSLLALTHVNGAGHTDEEKKDLRQTKFKVGPWQPEELATLKEEMEKGTPSHRLSRLLSRTISDVEGKMKQMK